MVSRRLAIIGRSLTTSICNGFKTLIMTWIETYTIDLAPKILVNVKMFTTSNFAHVDECLMCNDVGIVGTLSSFLNGAYVRNGNNPHHGPFSGYRFFDGTGMLHLVKMHDSKATYCSRYIHTNMYVIYNNFNDGNSL